jgi:hypothetical protein
MSKYLIIPDCQVNPRHTYKHLKWVGNYIAEKRPDVIVQIGDFCDMSSLSSFDIGKKTFEGRRYKDDIEYSREAMASLVKPFKSIRNYKPKMILTLGNHEERILRAVESDAKLEGTITINDLHYEKFGWKVYPFLQPVILDDIAFCHYFPSGQLGRPTSSARAILNKMHMSCIAGHLQGRDIAYAKRADGRQITAIIAGSCYLHDEDYLSPLTNQHWRGIVVLHQVNTGEADEMMVSLEYLEKEYA